MPRVSATALLQVALLLSAVPAQYFISRWYGSTATQRFHATTRLLRIWKDLRSSYLNGTAWTDDDEFLEKRYIYMTNALLHLFSLLNAASKTIRKPRPPYVFLRVGEVVLESKRNMVGVVVSWDPELRAPAEWVDRVYSDFEVSTRNFSHTPHYKVLFNGPGESSLLVAYLPQTQLERVTGMKPNIPTLENYFTHFDGERFVMQPWLRAMFPEDEDTEYSEY
uniref:Hemimethylated DNA-binding domain-containing protein n=1 Tax=Periophthalmus magnuspinnatus TaxID=409849 RepID=A0A3B4ASI0_9GOBI